jgi:urate oxidase / 2-oxo-4-hydroxy-4-carboxy-5-ureidoimidazoline decarboxylase
MSIHYGKSAVTVYRTDGRRTLFGAEVKLDVFGDGFMPAYARGDNSMVVPTDTMNNFIHAVALEYGGASLEEFLALAGRRFLDTYPHVERLQLKGRELVFERESEALFQRRHDDYGVSELTMDRAGIREHRSGREALHLIKVTGSAFAQFLRDGYTTLPEAEDRPLFIHLNVYWRYRTFDERVASASVRTLVSETFAAFVSKSIQHLLHEMARQILARFLAIDEVALEAENRLWDTARVSEADPKIRVYCDPRPPYGVIGFTLRRE